MEIPRLVEEFFEYDYNGDYPTSRNNFTEENGQKKPTGSIEYKY